jgi:hypothetical protein
VSTCVQPEFGSSSTAHLRWRAVNANLDYSYICYDGNTSGCPFAVVSTASYITERKTYHFSSNGSIYSIVDLAYDQYGNNTSEMNYDYAGSGNPVIRSVITTTSGESSSPYHSLCTTSNIWFNRMSDCEQEKPYQGTEFPDKATRIPCFVSYSWRGFVS